MKKSCTVLATFKHAMRCYPQSRRAFFKVFAENIFLYLRKVKYLRSLACLGFGFRWLILFRGRLEKANSTFDLIHRLGDPEGLEKVAQAVDLISRKEVRIYFCPFRYLPIN